eukprot:TRINITY_DN101523_c0_g1_i1.p1 TRINITY_DN101523_c0_g1~~TRINITY_DN101523_c0_g1_i1.p1  ORF type:complete len:338 (-),score=37.10 TRINITY_DN101523_c0_g1_i1:37-1050(-)
MASVHGFKQWDTDEPLKNILSSSQYRQRLQTDIESTGDALVNPDFGTVTLPEDCLNVLWQYLEEEALPELQRRSEAAAALPSSDWMQKELGQSQTSFFLRKSCDRSDFDKVLEGPLATAVFETLRHTLREAAHLDISSSNIEFRLDTADIAAEFQSGDHSLSYSSNNKRRRWHTDAEGTSRLLCTLYGIRTPYVQAGLRVWIPRLPQDSDKTYQHRDTYESIVVPDEVYERATQGDVAHQPIGFTAAAASSQLQEATDSNDLAPAAVSGATGSQAGLSPTDGVQCVMNSVVREGIRCQLLHGFVTAEEVDRTQEVVLSHNRYKRIFMMIDHVKEACD